MFFEIPTVALSLGAAFLFSLGAQCQNQGLAELDSRAGTMLTITTSAIIYWSFAPFYMETAYWLGPGVLIFAGIGLFRPALSANLAVTGMRYLGPTVSSTLTSTGPFFGAALGVLWLGEVLTWQDALGTFGIVAAVILLAKRGGGKSSSWPLWALALPIAAAAIRSAGHVFTKVGMEYVPDPMFAAVVSFSVSAIIATTAHTVRKGGPKVRLSAAGPRWFILAGIVMSTALLMLNHALLQGTIIEVVPVVAISPVFTMMLSVLVFRRERLTSRAVLAVAVVVPSVMIIALSA